MAKEQKKQTLEDWWVEDADRINSLSEPDRLGVIDCNEGKPPRLNPDGSLRDGGKK